MTTHDWRQMIGCLLVLFILPRQLAESLSEQRLLRRCPAPAAPQPLLRQQVEQQRTQHQHQHQHQKQQQTSWTRGHRRFFLSTAASAAGFLVGGGAAGGGGWLGGGCCGAALAADGSGGGGGGGPASLAAVQRALELKRRPEPQRAPRRKLEQDFAVLLMRSSYGAADELDFVAMDQFQKEFFLFRQDEYPDYLESLQGAPMMQGDLRDIKYLDFISFAQHDTISSEVRAAERVLLTCSIFIRSSSRSPSLSLSLSLSLCSSHFPFKPHSMYECPYLAPALLHSCFHVCYITLLACLLAAFPGGR
jgi:hypothetical protein